MTTELQPEPTEVSGLSENVVVLRKGEKVYYLLGTAHVSKKSVEEVGFVIDKVRPDTVCVELCQTRYQSLTEENQWRKLNIVQVIKQGKALMLMASLALSSFQRKMGDKLGVKPGAELLEGVNQAKARGAELVLADRDIQVTLKRTWGNLSFWKKMMVISGLLESVLSSEEISEEELEKMKESDHLNEMMQEFARTMPDVKRPLIDERDQYLMSKIEEAPGNKVVAVVGAGHLKGMQEYFGKQVDREAISQLPPPSIWTNVFSWAFSITIVAAMAYGVYSHRDVPLYEVIGIWALPTGILAGLFTAIAGGRIVTILTATISAPLTTLIPVLGVGMVAGTVEGYLRKPTVEDCERIPEDVTSIKGVYRNPFTRTLLVFMLSNLGASLGTLIATGKLAMFFK